MTSARSTFLAMGMSLLLVACGGDDDPTGVNGGNGNGDDDMVLDNPSFADDINPIFSEQGCSASQCHGGGEAGLTLSSDAAANRAELVDVASTQESEFLRVDPGDAENSYLVIKLEGRQSVGDQMPLDQSPIDDIDLGNIRNWIDNGAPDN
ncbi:MAG: hypothetical protein U5R14_14500 [Gemmatimonadota bacterium]|nr:hypothetical protein [Gemmatimonadota bacterium]